MNSIDTQPVFNKLDIVFVDVDSIIIKFSWIFGLVGLAVSVALIIISVVNFLGTAASLGGAVTRTHPKKVFLSGLAQRAKTE